MDHRGTGPSTTPSHSKMLILAYNTTFHVSHFRKREEIWRNLAVAYVIVTGDTMAFHRHFVCYILKRLFTSVSVKVVDIYLRFGE